MFYSVDGKIVQVGGAFPERRVNTLTFQVEGDKFPIRGFYAASSDRTFMWFDSFAANSVTVNWGDGVVDTYDFGTDFAGGFYRIGWTANGLETTRGLQGDTLAPVHTFQDGFTGRRNITFEFENLKEIKAYINSAIELHGNFPEDLGVANNLESFSITRANNLDAIPSFFSSLINLTNFSVTSSFINSQPKLPDDLFSSPLTRFATDQYDLRDRISSNLFKINQTKNTLQRVEFSSSIDFTDMPDEFGECTNIVDARLGQVKNVAPISNLINLDRLYISWWDESEGWLDFSGLNKLRDVIFGGIFLFNNLVNDWAGLVSLKSILVIQFWMRNNQDFDNLIDGIYDLVVTRAYLDPATAPVEEEYPNQFRDISWGHSSLTQTGEIKAPAVEGDPQNQGEKIHELVNKYGHNVTTSGNFN